MKFNVIHQGTVANTDNPIRLDERGLNFFTSNPNVRELIETEEPIEYKGKMVYAYRVQYTHKIVWFVAESSSFARKTELDDATVESL